MKQWVCKKHEDIVLFSEDDEHDSKPVKRLSIIPILADTPQHCPKCDCFYYRHECMEKEV